LRVYLASSFELKDRVQRISDLLEERGIGITRKWWLKDYKRAFGKIADDEWYSNDEVQSVSRKNFEAIDQAHAVILVSDDKTSRKFVGANIEVGYALAKGKLVFSVGALERSAMYVPVERHAAIDTVIKVLENPLTAKANRWRRGN
jgi:nucleoside 2-deoxyribosyltransferase